MGNKQPYTDEENWDPNDWQGRSKKQVDSDRAVGAFAVICLLATLVFCLIYEVYLYLSK
jgi:hypothetical protein